MTIEYVVANHGHLYPDDAIEFMTKTEGFSVSALARDYFDNHDGRKDAWPLTFEVYVDGRLSGTFKVGYKAEPVFCAKVISGEVKYHIIK